MNKFGNLSVSTWFLRTSA